jgi:hypothetical protein
MTSEMGFNAGFQGIPTVNRRVQAIADWNVKHFGLE